MGDLTTESIAEALLTLIIAGNDNELELLQLRHYGFYLLRYGAHVSQIKFQNLV